MKREEDAFFQQPRDKYQVYRVETGTCYDDVVERNLNTGLPKGISYITEKQLKGKKKKQLQKDEVEVEIPFEENLIYYEMKRCWKVQQEISKEI